MQDRLTIFLPPHCRDWAQPCLIATMDKIDDCWRDGRREALRIIAIADMGGTKSLVEGGRFGSIVASG